MSNTSPLQAEAKILKFAVVDSVKMAMLKRNRVALACGAVLGGFVPAATFTVAHLDLVTATDATSKTVAALLVAGGLIYSAMSVFEFARQAFKSPFKAFGFVLLIEGAMTFSHTAALNYAALTLLVAINAVAAGCNLALDAKGATGSKKR